MNYLTCEVAGDEDERRVDERESRGNCVSEIDSSLGMMNAEMKI